MKRLLLLLLCLAPALGLMKAQTDPSLPPTPLSSTLSADTLLIEPAAHHSSELDAPAVKEDHTLMWIPDSLREQVDHLLEGRFKVVRDNSLIDLNETTVFRGDTIPMILKDRNLGRFDRGLFNHLFVPKGTWSFGLTASYGEFSTSDLEIFDVLNDIDLSAHSFSIKPSISYFIRNNLSIGLRLGYTNSKAAIGSFKVDIDEDMNFNLKDIMYRSEQYTAAIALRQYIGIARRGRFGVFNELELAFSSGNSDFNRPFNSVLKETHTTYMDARLTFSPGLCVFVMKNVSFNISFGVFGFYLRNEKQITDGESSGNRLTSGANFKINLFNIAFGLGVHI